MKTLSQLDVFVPQLEDESLKKIIGGDWYSFMYGYIGGAAECCARNYITPSYCIAEREPSYSAFELYVYQHMTNPGWDMVHPDEWDLGGSSYTDITEQESHVTFDDRISIAEQEAIMNVIESLPEELQDMDVNLIIDKDLLFSLPGGKQANGCFLPKDYILPDGTKLTEDTIILKGIDYIDILREEKIHQWQYNNCKIGQDGKLPTNVVGCMEFQHHALEYVLNFCENPNGMHSSICPSLDNMIAPFIYRNSNDQMTFDFRSFLGSMDYIKWNTLYDEWNKASNRESINSISYLWNWTELFEMFFSDSYSAVVAPLY